MVQLHIVIFSDFKDSVVRRTEFSDTYAMGLPRSVPQRKMSLKNTGELNVIIYISLNAGAAFPFRSMR